MASTHVGSGPVSLREVLPKARFTRGGDLVVAKHTSDWRDCAPGDLYVALTTADGDGHEYAREAIARGAIAVLAERLLPVDAPVVIVKDTRTALGRLTQALAGFPCRTLRTVGSHRDGGQDRHRDAARRRFSKRRARRSACLSSVGYSDSLMQVAAQEATPSTRQFGEWLARMVSAGCDSAVIELSSRALAERRAAGIELDAAVLTNIRRDHLDLHNTPQAYRKSKRRLFTPAQVRRPGGDQCRRPSLAEPVAVARRAVPDLRATCRGRHLGAGDRAAQERADVPRSLRAATRFPSARG